MNRAAYNLMPQAFRQSMVYAGFSVAQANEELSRLFAAPMVPVLRDHYVFRMSRVGASFTLNRAQRIHIFEAFEAAQRVAAFESDFQGV